MKQRPLCLLGTIVALILSIVAASPLPLTFLPRDLKRAMTLYETKQSAVISGVISGIEEKKTERVVLLKNVTLERGAERLGILKVKVHFAEGDECADYQCGWTLRVRGLLSKIPGASNPGEFDASAYYRVQGICFQMREPVAEVLRADTDLLLEWTRWVRERINQRIRTLFPGDVSEILCAMLTGERSGLDEETRSLWRNGGIAHMLAISGLHLSLLGMGLFALLRRLGVPLRPAGFLSAAALLLYLILIGGQISALRAFLMFSVMMGAKLLGRTYDPPTALSFAVILILLTNPEYITYSGFQMSCCAVLIAALFRRRSRPATALLLYLWMLPLVAADYNEIPLLSVGINLFAVPLLPVILGSSVLCRLLFAWNDSGAARSFFAFGGTVVLEGMNAVLAFINRLPASVLVTGHPSVPRTVLYLAALLIWTALHWRYRLYKRRFLLLAAVPFLIAILAVPSRKHLKITVLSVGQGDGICIETAEGKTALIDGGSTTAFEVGRKRLLPFLKYEGIRGLDYVIATHVDEDHISGIRELLDMCAEGSSHLEIGTLLLPLLAEKDEKYMSLEEEAGRAGVRVLHVQRGDSFRMGETELRILGPDPSLETEPLDRNAQCIVSALHYRDFDALLTGDVSGEVETQLLEGDRGGEQCTYELLKVAHHGSRASTTEEFLEAVRPAVSVISCGEGNLYGHPHEELLERLNNCGSMVYRTDVSGAVSICSDGRKYWVTVKTP